MAKGKRLLFSFACSVCKNKNYTSDKNPVENKEKLTLNKFCKHCRKSNPHNETKV